MDQLSGEEQEKLKKYAQQLSEQQNVFSLSMEERTEAISLLEKYIETAILRE